MVQIKRIKVIIEGIHETVTLNGASLNRHECSRTRVVPIDESSNARTLMTIGARGIYARQQCCL